MAAEADRVGIVGADEINLASGRDLVFHAQRPVGGIDQQAAKWLVLEIAGMAHGRGENARGLARPARIGLDPGDGDRFHSRLRRVIGTHAGEHLSHDERLAIAAQLPDRIDIRRPPDVLDAPEDRVVFHSPGDKAAGAFALVAAVVRDPGFAEHLATESAVPLLAAETVPGVGFVFSEVERVRCRADADDRLAGVYVFDDILHLVVGQVAKAGENHHQVGGPKRLEAGDVVIDLGIDGSVFGIDGEENRALEAVVHGEDLGQRRHGFLGAILLVARNEDDVLAFAGTVVAVIDDPRLVGCGRADCEADKNQACQGRLRKRPSHGAHFALLASGDLRPCGATDRIALRARSSYLGPRADGCQ